MSCTTSVLVSQVEHQSDVAAPREEEPFAASLVKRPRKPRRCRVEAERDLVLRHVGCRQAVDADYAAHAVAIGDGKGAGIHLDAAHDRRVDRAEDALEIL